MPASSSYARLRSLHNQGYGRVGKEFLLDILDEHFSEAEAERQSQTLVDWGRYAQLFECDADEERLYQVEPEQPKVPGVSANKS